MPHIRPRNMSDNEYEYEVEEEDVEDDQDEEAAVPDEEEETPVPEEEEEKEETEDHSSSRRGESSDMPSLRGAAEHEREDIVRRQNAIHQRRTRERHRREHREPIERHRAQIEQLDALEARIAAIIRVLENAGIPVPDVVEERMGDPDADDGRRLFAELEAYIDEYNRSSQ